MASIQLSRRALIDIAEIENASIASWGEVVAADYLQSIEDALNLLRANPGLLKTKQEISEALCFYRVRQHFLVCAILEEKIVVLTIKHGAMDLPTRIAELEPQLLQEAEWLLKQCATP